MYICHSSSFFVSLIVAVPSSFEIVGVSVGCGFGSSADLRRACVTNSTAIFFCYFVRSLTDF